MTQRKLGKFGAANAVSIQSNVGGSGTLRVKVDYSQVPAPDAYYVADYARIMTQGTSVQLIFGKLEGTTERTLRNKLEVNIPAYAFVGQWMASMEFIDQLKGSMDSKGFPVYETPKDINEKTDKVQTVHANSTFVSGGESECCIDLYFLAPRDIRFYLEKSEPAHLEPLVRIITEARLFVGLGQSFRDIADKVRQYAPPVVEEEQAEEQYT